MAKELLQYNIDYDRHESDSEFLKTQIQTHLKERFNTLISTVEYEIIDEHLVRPGKTEPFINSIKRGRDIIQSLSLNTVDFDREDAEVRGFEEKIDPFLSNPQTSLGSKILSISLKGEEGSKYQHNFYDIFTLKARNGKRYVEMSRYSSVLTAQDYSLRLDLYPKNPLSAAQFLANPILINNVFITAEQIHQELHEKHEYMESSDFDEIWKIVRYSTFVERYLRNRDAHSFNAILNFADEVWENEKRREQGDGNIDYSNYVPSYNEVRYFEEKEVRQVATGCPGKSGANANDNSPWSVSEFDSDYSFDKPGPCKRCGSDVKCGPCGICRNCDMEMRRGQSFKIAA